MKIACEQCETVMDDNGLVGWLELGWHGIGIETYGQKRLPVVFCGGECAIAWLSKAPYRGHQADLQMRDLRTETQKANTPPFQKAPDVGPTINTPSLTSRQAVGDPNA